MTLRAILESPAWDAAGWTMLHLVWLGGLLGMSGATLRRLTRRSVPEVRYAVAVGLLALMSAAPVLLFARLYEPAPPLPSVAPTAIRGEAGAVAVGAVRPAFSPSRRPAIGAITPLESAVGPNSSRLEAIVAGLPLFWLVGSTLTSLFLAAGVAGTRVLRRESRVVGEGEALEMAARLADSLGLARRFGLGVCDRIASPMLLGIVRPLVLLPPAALSGWTVDELEMALLHELAHLRRHDNLVNLWQCLVESLLFFHPVAWWLSAWVRLERERCCDRLVVERTGKARPYAELLASLAGVPPGRAAGSPMAERPVVSRIRAILNKEEKPMRLTLPEGFGLVGAALLAGALAIGAHADPGPMAGKESTNGAKREALKALAREAAGVSVDTPGFDDRGEALLVIARAQFQVGDREAALDTMRRAAQALESGAQQAKIPPSFAAWVTKTRLADVWWAIGDADAARAALDRATDELKAMTAPENRETLLKAAALVPEMAEAGDPVGGMVAESASTIIEVRIQLGDLDEARRLIDWTVAASEGVKGPMRPLISSFFASMAAQSGDLPRARSLARRAEREALALPAGERARHRQFAARVLAECGELDGAFAILKEQDPAGLESAANGLLDAFHKYDPDEFSGWLDLAGIKILIGTRGTKPKARPDALCELAAHFRGLDDAKVKARSLSTIASLLAKAGEPRSALEVAETIPALSRSDGPAPSDGFYDSVKPGTFAMIAARMAKAGDRDGAAGAFDRSRALARAIGSPGERLIALIVLADALADTGDRPAAVSTVLEGVEVAKDLPEPRRSRGLVMLIRARAKAGDPAGAVPMVDSLRDYPGIERAQALVSLAHAFEEAGDGATSRTMAGKALEAAKVERPEGFKLGPATKVQAIGPDTFLDPDLEFEEPLIRFQLSEVTDQARGLLDVAEAERVARARPVVKQKGMLGGRNTALGMLANNLAFKGKLDEAMRIAGSIEEPHDKLWAYQQMARAIRDGRVE